MTAESQNPLDELTFTVASVARRLGVAPATLRTWDRRYGLGPSGHTAGLHRRYTETDLKRLELMRRLVNQGTLASEAARVAIRMNLLEADIESSESETTELHVTDLQLVDAPSRALARTALALDTTGCSALINQALNTYGAKTTWVEIVTPVLKSVGERWLNTGRGIEVEHVLSQSISSALFQYTSELVRPRNQRTVLMAAAPEEQHTLPLLATAAVLKESGIGSSLLGPRVPVVSLGAAIDRIGPSAVFIWSQITETGDPYHLAELPQTRPPAKFLLGGPGWAPGWPPHFVRVTEIDDAITLIKAAALA